MWAQNRGSNPPSERLAELPGRSLGLEVAIMASHRHKLIIANVHELDDAGSMIYRPKRQKCC